MLPSRTRPDIVNIHASCVAAGSRGILLLGLSGQGKSDLALRLIDRGARLVADDRCDIWFERDRLWCRPPAELAGKLEVRGLGIVEKAWVAPVPLAIAVRLADRYERMPPERAVELDRRARPAVADPVGVRGLGADQGHAGARPAGARSMKRYRRTAAAAGHRPVGCGQIDRAQGARGSGLGSRRQSAARAARNTDRRAGEAQRGGAAARGRDRQPQPRVSSRTARAADQGAARGRRARRPDAVPRLRRAPNSNAAFPKRAAATRWPRIAPPPTASRASAR